MKILRKSWAVGLLLGGVAIAQQPANPTPTDVKGYEVAIKTDVRHVIHLRQKSRQAKDVIKLNCVNDKYIQIKALEKIFDTQRTVDQPVVTDLATTADGIHKLRVEADTCVGEPELSGDSLNDYTEPKFPDDPTKGDPHVPGGGIEPPGYASPYS